MAVRPTVGVRSRRFLTPQAHPRRNGRAAVVAVAAASMLGLHGCGSSDGGESGAGDDDTYTLMVIGPLTASASLPTPFPEIETGAEAAAKVINDNGGVNGKKIHIVACDTKAEPNEATKCAQQAVKDGVIAAVGTFDFKGDYISVLERAGIPVLAPFSQAVELTNPVSYPVNGGSPTLLAGEISALATQGARDITFVAAAAAVEGEDLSVMWNPVIESFPGLEVNMITAPSDAPDLSAVAQKASDGDSVAIGLQAAQFVPFVKALKQTSDISLVGSDTGSLDATVIEALGSDVEGTVAATNYLPSTTTGNEAVDAYNAALEAIDPDASKNDFSVLGYLGVNLFAQAADGLADVTSASIREVLDSGKEFDLGLVRPMTFTEPSTAIEGTTRMFNTTVVYNQLQDGEFVPIDGEFVDAFTGQPAD